MKNSLNFANTCLKVVDTRRSPYEISLGSSVRQWGKIAGTDRGRFFLRVKQDRAVPL